MNVNRPFQKVGSRVQKGCNRTLLQMGFIVLSANGAGKQKRKGFVKVFCAFFIRVGWIFWIPQCNNVNGVPKKRAPYTGRKLHSNYPSSFI